MTTVALGQIVVDTLVQGAVIAPLTMGMTLVYGVSRFANVVQVEFATLSAYGTLVVGSVVGGGLLLDSLISVALTGVIAVGLYYLVFLRLLRRSAMMALIGSLALSIVIRAFIQTVAGPDPRQFDLPLERGTELLGGNITPSVLHMSLISLGSVLLVLALLRFTALGRRVRAVSTNPELAAAAGINGRRVSEATWLLAGILGGIAGTALAVSTEVTTGMGFAMIIPVFGATLLGGIGSVGATPIVAAYLLAAAQSVPLYVNIGAVFSSDLRVPLDYRPAVGFAVLLVALVVRPNGLFGSAVRRG
ncbi:branched-chain amino acid ABC transporter permease [Streptomyces sp. NPDC005708]|uniref:branched-chain amino acid ABC transporter permease n=1 Tax=Streptomyces sp. NPDC005708 TaxID=3154564 RepID=UPI0033FFFE4E